MTFLHVIILECTLFFYTFVVIPCFSWVLKYFYKLLYKGWACSCKDGQGLISSHKSYNIWFFKPTSPPYFTQSHPTNQSFKSSSFKTILPPPLNNPNIVLNLINLPPPNTDSQKKVCSIFQKWPDTSFDISKLVRRIGKAWQYDNWPLLLPVDFLKNFPIYKIS